MLILTLLNKLVKNYKLWYHLKCIQIAEREK